MQGFFTRIIERTRGIAETVQPLSVPTYGSFSYELGNSYHPERKLSIPEKIEEMRSFKLPEDSTEVNNSEGNPRHNKNLHSEELIPDEFKNIRKPIARTSDFIIEDDGERFLLNAEEKVSEKKLYGNNKTTRNKDETEQARGADPILPETRAMSGQKLDRDTFSQDTVQFHKKEISSTDKKKKYIEKSYPSLLPNSFEGLLLPKRSAMNLHIEHDVSKDDKRESSIPSVRVTIGRVEVRAVMNQSPKPKPREQPQPKLKLDDYLKQRSEGKR